GRGNYTTVDGGSGRTKGAGGLQNKIDHSRDVIYSTEHNSQTEAVIELPPLSAFKTAFHSPVLVLKDFLNTAQFSHR
ncbi:hypothetical protein BaRGS_00024332, partial [Batillaria attramentaria]